MKKQNSKSIRRTQPRRSSPRTSHSTIPNWRESAFLPFVAFNGDKADAFRDRIGFYRGRLVHDCESPTMPLKVRFITLKESAQIMSDIHLNPARSYEGWNDNEGLAKWFQLFANAL